MDRLIRWKVVSSRAYYWGKKIMKPGQIFMAYERELPDELKSMVIAVDVVATESKPEPTPEPTPEVVKVNELVVNPATKYRVRERKGGEYYDVVDSLGKKVNENNLTKDEAMDMLKSLVS